MFPQFPYLNLHELNLDWIIEQLQRTMNFAVLSVNGQTGDVVLYTDPTVEYPAIDSTEWQIIRTANGRTVGIMFQNDKMYLRYGGTMSEVYTADNPPAYPVSSVNGQTGAVVTYPEAAVRLPDVDDAYTNIRRQIDSSGTPAIVGIEVDKTKAVRMNGTLRKKIYDEDNQPPYPVTSVNGQTGDIIIAVPIEPLSIDQSLWQAAEDSPNHTAGFSRFTLDGNVSIYLTSDSSKVEAYIDYLSTDEQTSYTRKLLTTDDIPSAAGVVSINGMNGVVTLYGTDISMSFLDSRNITNIITGLEADVPGIGESVAWYEPGNTASQNIRQGEYVIWNNAAYQANTNIFSGDPLSGSVLDALTGGITNAFHADWLARLNEIISLTGLCTFTENVTGTNTRIHLKGNVVYVYYQGESKTHAANDVLFTLPAGYRPSGLIYAPFVINNTGYGNIAVDDVTGNVFINQVANGGTAGRVYAMFSFCI